LHDEPSTSSNRRTAFSLAVGALRPDVLLADVFFAAARVGKPTRFRVESSDFKRLKWEILCDRNSNAESASEFG
jgi:hypothetical protein